MPSIFCSTDPSVFVGPDSGVMGASVASPLQDWGFEVMRYELWIRIRITDMVRVYVRVRVRVLAKLLPFRSPPPLSVSGCEPAHRPSCEFLSQQRVNM